MKMILSGATGVLGDAAIDWLGGLDTLVNVAGAFDWKKIEDSSIAD